MPTYDYRCPTCDSRGKSFQSIRDYCRDPVVPKCQKHGSMERMLTVTPLMSGGAVNVLAGDRHYEGLRGPNGEDIGSRTKHKEFMARTGLATVDDFKGDFDKAAKERQALRNGTFQDKELRDTVTEKVMTDVLKTE